MHWNTVSMAKAKLSKLVMPCLGPSQPALHSVPFWHCRPWADWGAHGDGSSSAGVSARREGHRACDTAEPLRGQQMLTNLLWSGFGGFLRNTQTTACCGALVSCHKKNNSQAVKFYSQTEMSLYFQSIPSCQEELMPFSTPRSIRSGPSGFIRLGGTASFGTWVSLGVQGWHCWAPAAHRLSALGTASCGTGPLLNDSKVPAAWLCRHLGDVWHFISAQWHSDWDCCLIIHPLFSAGVCKDLAAYTTQQTKHFGI